MVHRKLIGPALAAVAGLLALSGVAAAQSPADPATLFAAPAISVPAVVPAEPCDTEAATGPDTDNIQEGDQTGPDEACAADAAAAVSGATTTSVVTAQSVSTAGTADAAPAEQGTESETAGETGPSDGPGGHQDTGANADHQFEGEE
jgi:hypothetical protein